MKGDMEKLDEMERNAAAEYLRRLERICKRRLGRMPLGTA